MNQPNSEPDNLHFGASAMPEDPVLTEGATKTDTKHMRGISHSRFEREDNLSKREESQPYKLPSGKRSRKTKKIVSGVLFLVVVIVGGYQAISYLKGSSNPASKFDLETVQRGPFRVVVSEPGILRSFSNVTLRNTVAKWAETSIIKLAPEGTEVKKPTVTTLAGIVTKILESGSDRTVTVKSDPLFVATSPFFVHVEGDAREFIAPFGEFSQMLVEVGDRVKVGDRLAGDVVCELDASNLEDIIKSLKISLTQVQAAVQKTQKDVVIQRTLNRSNVAKAQLDLDLAILNFKKFEEGERSQLLNEAKSQVLLAQEELKQTEEKYIFDLRLARKYLKILSELDSSRIARDRKKNNLDLAKDKLKILTDFTFVRNLKEFKENVEEARLELRRAKLIGSAALDKFKATLKSAELRYSVRKGWVNLCKSQIQACKMVAPQDGKVVYAHQRSWKKEVIIEEGISVWPRQRIIDLPDFEKMGVETSIHESKIGKIDIGMHVNIRISSFPGKIYQGEIIEIGSVPFRGEWPNSDQMFYRTKVKLIGKHIQFKPNMNAALEIISEEREDVLQVPVQALFSIGNELAAYIFEGKEARLVRNIEIGSNNDERVEILTGLDAGDRVVMRPRDYFANEIDKLLVAHENEKDKEISESVKRKKNRELSNAERLLDSFLKNASE